MGVPDGPFCPVLFPHCLTGCLLRSGENIVSQVLSAPLPRGPRTEECRTRLSLLSHLTVYKAHLHFQSEILLAKFINTGFRSPVYELGPPEGVLLSPLDLFIIHSVERLGFFNVGMHILPFG